MPYAFHKVTKYCWFAASKLTLHPSSYRSSVTSPKKANFKATDREFVQLLPSKTLQW